MNTQKLADKTERLAQIGSWEWDVDHDLWTFTAGFRRICGLIQPDLITTARLRACIHPEDTSALEKAVDDALATNGSLDIEHRVIRENDGEIRFLHTWAEVEFEEQGKSGRICGVTQDVTVRKRTEAKLHQFETKFATAFAASPAGIAISRKADGRYLDANPAFLEMVGYRRDELIGNRSIDLQILTQAERDSLVNYVNQQVTTAPFELLLRSRNGNRIIALAAMDSVEIDGESCLLTFALDLSERKRLEAELSENERKLRDFYDNSPDMYVSTDPISGLILDCNRTLLRTLAYTRDELIGQPGSLLLTHDSHAKVEGIRPQFLQAGSYENLETQVRCKDGSVLDVLLSATLDPENAQHGPMSRITLRNITERKAAEAALRLNEAKYRALFDTGLIGILLTDPLTGKIHAANQEACRLLGYSDSEILDQDRSTIMATPRDRLTSAIQQRAATQSFRGEQQMRRADGSIFPADFASSLLSPNEPHSLASIFFLDTSIHAQLEEALRSSEERYRLLADDSPLPIAVTDLETGEVLYGNDQLEQLFALNDQDGAPRFARDFYADPADRKQIAETLRSQGAVTDVEMRMRTQTGSDLWVSVNARIGVFQGRRAIQTVFLDATERHRLQDSLRASEARFRLVVENSPDVIAIYDASARMKFINESVRQVVGQPHEFVIAREANLPDFNTAGAGEIALSMLAGGMSEENVKSRLETAEIVRQCVSHLDERRTAQFTIRKPETATISHLESVFQGYRVNAQDVEVVSVTHDVTKYKLLEEELMTANTELEERVSARTAQLAAALEDLHQIDELKDAFLAAVSHELRTPLTGVLSMVDVLEIAAAGPLNERQLRYVGIIRMNGERLLKMVNSILHYTSLISGRRKIRQEPCRLAELAGASIRAVRDLTTGKQQQVNLQVVPNDLEIVSDSDGVLQILENLLENASKFTPDGGRLGVVMALTDTPPCVTVTVWDTGIGIAPEKQARVFNVFEQLDNTLSRQYQGVGLGLAYVHEMVTRLGGTIAIESELGKGSQFLVTLPIGELDLARQA